MSPEDSDQQEEFTWEAYYKSLEGREPRSLFTEALAKFGDQSGRGLQAVDLGCGDGTETGTRLAVRSIGTSSTSSQEDLIFINTNDP